MKILVTGASGFIGGRFARFALEQGMSVRINGRRADAVEHLVRRGAEFRATSPTRIWWERCAMTSRPLCIAPARSAWGRRQDFVQGNVQLTENIVEGCLKQRVRKLVHLSSPSIYFNGQSRRDITEDQVPKRFHNYYAATKYMAEQKVFGAAEFGLEVIALAAALRHRRRRQQYLSASVADAAQEAPVDHRQWPEHGRLHQHAEPQRSIAEQSAGNRIGTGQGLQHQQRHAGAAMGCDQLCDAADAVAAGYPLSFVRAGLQRGGHQRSLWPGRPEPTLTRLGMQVMNKDFTLDISRARHYLDYQPQVSLWTALDEFCGWWQAQSGM